MLRLAHLKPRKFRICDTTDHKSACLAAFSDQNINIVLANAVKLSNSLAAQFHKSDARSLNCIKASERADGEVFETNFTETFDLILSITEQSEVTVRT